MKNEIDKFKNDFFMEIEKLKLFEDLQKRKKKENEKELLVL